MAKLALVARFPEFADIIAMCYVDNCFIGCSSVAEGNLKAHMAKEIFSTIDMNLREYYCNNMEILRDFSERSLSDNHLQKILGLPWNALLDVITWTIQYKTLPTKKITKRVAARILSSLFDPTGILIPAILPGRLFLQKLWDYPYQWNDELLPDHQVELAEIIAALQGEQLSLPRAIVHRSPGETITLVLFSDASSRAYATVAYLRVENEFGVSVHQIKANFKLVPLRGKERFTIPKVELLGLYLSGKLALFLFDKLELTFDSVHFFGDNTATLAWLSKPPREGVFVRNRLQFLTETFSFFASKGLPCHVHYVESKVNPADRATRGLSGAELAADHVWLRGPDQLLTPPVSWPVFQPRVVDSPDLSEAIHPVVLSEDSFPLEPIAVELEVEPQPAKPLDGLSRALLPRFGSPLPRCSRFGMPRNSCQPSRSNASPSSGLFFKQ
ncbi:unnamed protein product, partial [Mesorhabditis spiculigera]